jgi:TolB-like protein
MCRSLAVVVAGLLLVVGAGRSPAQAPAKLAILPIVVHSLDDKAYLEAGLADMLASRLGRVDGVAVIRVQGEDRGTTDLEAARASAREAGAEYVIFGSFTQFGQGASLDLECASVSADDELGARSIFIHSGTLGEIIPQLDRVAEKVGRHLASGAAWSGTAFGSLPAVGAAAPAEEAGSANELVQDALSELEALRSRVDALEEQVYAAPVGSVEEVDLGADPDTPLGEPELDQDLR